MWPTEENYRHGVGHDGRLGDKVADIEVDMVADMEVDMVDEININIEIQFDETVGQGVA